MSASGESIPFPKSSGAEAAAHAAPVGDSPPSGEPAPAPSDGAADASAAPQNGRTDSELFNRVVQGAHQTIDKLAGQAAPHVQRLQEGVAETGEMLQTQADQVRQAGSDWSHALRNTVREYPLASVAAALALGMVVARLTS